MVPATPCRSGRRLVWRQRRQQLAPDIRRQLGQHLRADLRRRQALGPAVPQPSRHPPTMLATLKRSHFTHFTHFTSSMALTRNPGLSFHPTLATERKKMGQRCRDTKLGFDEKDSTPRVAQ